MNEIHRQANPFGLSAKDGSARLTGRDEMLMYIGICLSSIAIAPEKESQERKTMQLQPIHLYGPPGSGKTALLEEARRTAEEKGIHVVSVTSLPNLAIGGQLVSGMLAGIGVAAFPWNLFAKLSQLNKKWRKFEEDGDVNHAPVSEIADLCLRRRPTALLLDQVEDYDIESLKAFLIAYETNLAYDCPTALLLAGTSEMFRTLASTKSSLLELGMPYHLALLEPAAAWEALGKPFEERGVNVQEDALAMMAGMADDYPQFIQIVGHEVWKAWAMAGRGEVDREIVSQAAAGVQHKRELFYQDIFSRIKTEGLIGHARHVMELLEINGGEATTYMIINSIDDGFAENGCDKGLDICYELMDLGFIWKKGICVEAGIPGLFDYCEKNEREGASPSVK